MLNLAGARLRLPGNGDRLVFALRAVLVHQQQHGSFILWTAPHQSQAYQTPQVVYASGQGGGALIVDKYGSAEPRAIETA